MQIFPPSEEKVEEVRKKILTEGALDDEMKKKLIVLQRCCVTDGKRVRHHDLERNRADPAAGTNCD